VVLARKASDSGGTTLEIKYSRTPMEGKLGDFPGPVIFVKVDETKWEPLWNKMVQEHHYLGYESVIGSRVKYIIALSGKVVGAISFCSAAYKLGLRDKFVGWDKTTRLTMLPHLVNNNRFLILPWVKIHNLASHVLSQSLKQLRVDWKMWYGVEPYMAETFVDSERFVGTCYVAANWIRLGPTKGYGRQGNRFIYHGRPKDLYVTIMNRRFASTFQPDISRLPKSDKEEFLAMILGVPHHYKGILDDLGVTDVTSKKIAGWLGEHLEPYLPYLNRKELWEHFVTLAKGMMGSLPRKSIEPIAMNYAGRSQFRSLLHFMSHSKWDNQGMLGKYQDEFAKVFSSPGSMLCVDGCDFPKAGNMSVGVQRQYCGTKGKVEGCQAGVFLSYAGGKGYGLLDYELYMPEKWLEEAAKDKREKCGVPERLEFKTKNEIALAMIRDMVASGRLQCDWLGGDSFFGRDKVFRDGLPEGLKFFVDVPCNTQVFLNRPTMIEPEHKGRGRKPNPTPDIKHVSVKEAIEMSDTPWSSVVLGIGTRGPFITRDKALKVVESRDGQPGQDLWLYARELDEGVVKYNLCNAPMDSTIETIRTPSMMRWSIEQTFKECKQHLGMDHYELRSWTGWRRHMLLVLICHLFVTKMRLGFGHEMKTPMSVPYVKTPVDLDEYLDVAEEMRKGSIIKDSKICSMPSEKQYILTFANISKLLDKAFPPLGEAFEIMDVCLKNNADSFQSNSNTKVSAALAARGQRKG
jgi:SRSO17 transposase